MDTYKLSVEEREESGNGPARRLRAKGMVPGVTYGKGKTPTSIAINLEDFKAAMAHSHHVVLELDFAKDAKPAKGAKKAAPRYAVIQQMQVHPTKRTLLHVDLHEVDLGVELETTVAVDGTGTPAGVQDGGIIEWERREVNVRALPSDLPEVIELDMSGLVIGQHLSVEALTAPKGVTILDEPETILVTLHPPRVDRVAETGEEVAEPEVIGSQKTEE